MRLDEVTEDTSSLVLDTGLLLEYLGDTKLGDEVSTLIVNNESINKIIISELTITEVFYIYCRSHGQTAAKELVQTLADSMIVVPTIELRILAGIIKCERSIALADCFAIAAAQMFDLPVLFKFENELNKQMKKEPFSQNVILIEDIQNNNTN